MKISTGKVIDAKGGVDGYVKVKLDHTGQEILAHYGNGMIQKGTYVTLISDNMHSYFVIGTHYNGMDEVVNIMLEWQDELIKILDDLVSMKTIDEADKAKWTHTKTGAFSSHKSKIQSLKERLSKFKF